MWRRIFFLYSKIWRKIGETKQGVAWGCYLGEDSQYSKECNYGMRVSESASRFTKFLVNSIYIYGFKSIYYKNTFCN
jgi:hypothetical protein